MSVAYRSHNLEKVFHRSLLNCQSDRATLFTNPRQHNTEPINDIYLGDTVCFVVRKHGIRDLKDTVSHDILKAFNAVEIKIATTSYDIVEFPPLAELYHKAVVILE